MRDDLPRRLRERAKEHRENGWELMREGDPKLLEDAADQIERYMAVVENLHRLAPQTATR